MNNDYMWQKQVFVFRFADRASQYNLILVINQLNAQNLLL